jgi:hypothetical protein
MCRKLAKYKQQKMQLNKENANNVQHNINVSPPYYPFEKVW